MIELKQQIRALMQQQKESTKATSKAKKLAATVMPLGRPAYSSPPLVTSSAYDASDFIGQLPPINEDLSFLQLCQKMAQQLGSDNLPSLSQPLIALAISDSTSGEDYVMELIHMGLIIIL